MNYDFHISDDFWKKAWNNAKKRKSHKKRLDGVLCAHCCLSALGLEMWEIRKRSKDV